MTEFERPCSGFTAADLISLQAAWPDGRHRSDADGDHYVIHRLGERRPWLSITRRRDGTYLSCDLAGRIFAAGASLADLALDGSGASDRAGAFPLIDETGRIDWHGGR